jgi:hypothetical protein
MHWPCSGILALACWTKEINGALEAFDTIAYNTREIVRPGRKNERKKRPKKLHYMNYKAL